MGRGPSRRIDGGLEPVPERETPETNRASEVVPEIRPAAPWRVRSLETLPGSRLRVTFMDGTRGEVDMAKMLASPQTDGTVFEPLRDPAFFSRARIVMGAV